MTVKQGWTVHSCSSIHYGLPHIGSSKSDKNMSKMQPKLFRMCIIMHDIQDCSLKTCFVSFCQVCLILTLCAALWVSYENTLPNDHIMGPGQGRGVLYESDMGFHHTFQGVKFVDCYYSGSILSLV